MPEQISKYPEVTVQVLKGAGARCGEGMPQKILTQCPAERFCSLSTGEICVYGIDQIPQMTQITPGELASVVCPSLQKAGLISGADGVLLATVFITGLVLGRLWQRLRAPERRPRPYPHRDKES